MNSNNKYQTVLPTFIILFSYSILGYFFKRNDFYQLFFLYSAVFIATYFLIKNNIFNSKRLFVLGLIFRLLFLFNVPFLSQDFYRFIWDGRLSAHGINPFDYKPQTIINTIAFSQAKELYEGMGSLSASHFSNYPPINQLVFLIAGIFSGKSIIGAICFFRVIIITADIGIFIFGKKILKHFNQNENKIYWYFLNPLVVIELTGNLHFEGLMLFFFLVGFYFLIKNKWLLASLFIALSISVKLLPLLLLPLFWQYLGLKKSVLFYASIIILNIIFFIPFLSPHLMNNYMETIALWFVNFEFNASIYYLVREVGYYLKGYNIIGTVGKVLPFVIIITVLFYAFIKTNNLKNILIHSLFILSIYFFAATTVHPWYLINLVLLSVFTSYKFPILWSFLIILSYYAYSVFPFKESFYLIFIEYSLVFALFFYELKYKPLKLFFYEK